jgi:hypothetical protein
MRRRRGDGHAIRLLSPDAVALPAGGLRATVRVGGHAPYNEYLDQLVAAERRYPWIALPDSQFEVMQEHFDLLREYSARHCGYDVPPRRWAGPR